ncbi:ATP-binding cassette domain-containing protein [Cellulomonas soli]
MQRAWMAKGVKNARRKSSDNDKIGRKFRSDSSEKQAAKARQTQRMIERLDVVAEPRKEWQLQMSIAAAPRSGAVVAAARHARVQRGDFVLGPVDVQLDWQDRVAITGPNGAGKTTLLALLLGRLAPTDGRVDRGRTCWSARSTRRGRRSRARSRWSTRSPARCPTGRRRTCARCWPSSVWAATTSRARRPRCRPVNAPGPPWRCCRPAA